VIDHAKKPGEKIRISGGGRCNFTNLYCEFKNYLGENPHFHKSALTRYTQWDFIALVDRYKIAWHEKTLGQLFCDEKATQIVDMMLHEMRIAGADLWLETKVIEVRQAGSGFATRVKKGEQDIEIYSQNLIIATGGKSIPKMGATGLAYDLAKQFGHEIIDTRAGLVPLTFSDKRFAEMSGLATDTKVFNDKTQFEEATLFTHRGLSGPAILQISSYWREGEEICVNLLPETDLSDILRSKRKTEGRKALTTELGFHIPSKLVNHLRQEMNLEGNLGDLSDKRIDALVEGLQNWKLKPSGSEGFRTAEVTLGGVSTSGLDSKSMMSKTIPGLYFIGEAVDVTGWLGGFNFQWAWSSGWVAGQHAAQRQP
jgi:predicted Rossmann fold flavoprotein